MGSYKYEELNKTDTSWVYNPEYGNNPISYNYSTYWKPKNSIDSIEGEVLFYYFFFFIKMRIFPIFLIFFKKIEEFIKNYIFFRQKIDFSSNNSAT